MPNEIIKNAPWLIERKVAHVEHSGSVEIVTIPTGRHIHSNTTKITHTHSNSKINSHEDTTDEQRGEEKY